MKFVRNQNRRAFSRNEGASADSMGHYGGSHTLSSPISIVSQHHQLGQRQGQSQGLSMLQTDMHTQSNSPTGLHYGSESEEIGDTNGFRESHGSAEDIEQFFISGDDWVKTQFNGNPRHYDHQNGVDPDYIYGSGSSTTDSNSCIVFVDRTVKDMFPFLSTPTPTSPFNAPQHSLSPPASPNAVIDMMSTMERTERTSSLPLPSAQSNFYYNARAMGDNLNGNQFVQPSVDDPRGRTPSPDQHLYSQGQTNFDNVNNLMQRTNVGMATRRSDLSYKSSSIDNQLERYISAARSERQGLETLTTNEGGSVTENEKIPTKIHQINKNKPKQQNHYNHQLQLQSEKDQITKLNGKGGKSKKARGSPFTSLNNNSSISSQIDSNLAPLEGFLSSNYFIKDGLTEQSGPFFLQQSLHCYPKALSLKELVGGVVPTGQGIGVDTGIGIGIGIGTGVGAGSGAGAGQGAPSKKRYRKHPASISMNKSRQENNSMCVLSSDSQDSSDQVYGSEFQNGKAQLFQQQQLQQQQQQQKEYQDRQQQLNDEGNTRFLRHDDKYHYDSGSFADSSCPQLNSQSQSKLSLEESKLASIMSSLSSETGNMLYGNRLDNNTSHEPKQMARRTRSATNNTNISVTDVDDDGVPGPHDRMRTQSENKYKEMDRARKCADYEYHNHIEVNMPEETEKEGDIEGEVERHQTQRQQQRTSMIDDLACTDIKVKYPADRESEREEIGTSPTRLGYKEREIIDYSDSSRQYVHLFDPFQRFDDFYAIGPSSSSSNSVNSLSINTTKNSFFTNPPWGCDYFGTDDRQKCTIGTRIGNGENASIEIARDDQLDQNVRPNSSM